MSGKRELWLTSHLLDDPAGAAAHREALALGRAVYQHVGAAGDRLAESSPILAQQYYRQAAAAWTAFGAAGFELWVACGEGLAVCEPACREGAIAYFGVAPSQLGARGLERAAAWSKLGRGLADTSPKLATIFLKTTASLLRRPEAFERLSLWVEVGRSLYDQHGWQGEFLAQAYLSSAPRALLALDPQSYRLWAGAGAALYPNVKEREFFGALSRGVRRWSDGDRISFLRSTLALAPTAPKAAFAFYRDLPAAIDGLADDERSALLGAFARAVKRSGAAIAEVAPVTGAVLGQLPRAAVLEALRLIEDLAARFPEGVAPAVRSLPKLYEEAQPRLVHEWFAKGVEVAGENARAGLAYFALESRTSLRVLRAASTAASLEESQGLLRKYVQMLSGQPVSVRAVEGLSLRPPLEEFPAENEVALPLRIDILPTHEDNLRLYRFLAAQVAGRREFATYEFVAPDGATDPETPPGSALLAYLELPDQPETLADLFLLAEGIRIQHRLCESYPGLSDDGRWVATRVLEAWSEIGAPTRSMAFDGLFALALIGAEPRRRPAWLDRAAFRLAERLLVPLGRAEATVEDSMRVARELAAALTSLLTRQLRRESEIDGILLDRVTGDALLDPYFDDEMAAEGEAARVPTVGQPEDGRQLDEGRKLELSPDESDAIGATQPLSPEELQRLLDSGAKLRISQGAGADVEGLGLYITDLIGKIPSEEIEMLRQLLGPDADEPRRRHRRSSDEGRGEPSFWYDEWDYHIGDYRSRWCRLHELAVEGDSGEFFQRALSDYARVIPEVRRQFQRIRPEMYRTVRGLEDGEDFDLNAAIDARIEARAGRAPSSKLYVARKREQRDVATLFLLDMSASTDEPLSKLAGEMPVGRAERRAAASRRIIDVTKETLVVMVEALEEIGDAYAIYGFSGHGRDNVEVYKVKSFSEALGSVVKGRLGAIEPKRSTRMGTALRHAIEKLAAVSSRSKHLFLLSDGFPQDFDYGQDRRSNVYGIRDTAAALREAEAAGITPFCITVDKAGHDYLRQMCDESRYMVIEDITALPRELPKIYQRVVRV